MPTLLEIRDLSISFGGVHAVQNVSFDVNQGEILALIGPNGSGKSTCVNLISGVYRPDAGQILFEGSPIKSGMSIDKRAHLGIYRTFQTPKPFGHMSVYNNVYAIALQKYSMSEAHRQTERVLEMMRLTKLKDMKASKISIEKRKWLDLSRILVLSPKLIMMDEVMAGLNHTEMEESLELVKEINRSGITVLFIEHVMKAVSSICTRAIVLNEGQLLFEGSTKDALTNEKVIEVYLGKEAKQNA